MDDGNGCESSAASRLPRPTRASDVTLVIPFLAPSEQKIIHPNMIFNTPEEQAEYVNKWVEERCGFKPQMKLSFYQGDTPRINTASFQSEI